MKRESRIRGVVEKSQQSIEIGEHALRMTVFDCHWKPREQRVERGKTLAQGPEMAFDAGKPSARMNHVHLDWMVVFEELHDLHDPAQSDAARIPLRIGQRTLSPADRVVKEMQVKAAWSILHHVQEVASEDG